MNTAAVWRGAEKAGVVPLGEHAARGARRCRRRHARLPPEFSGAFDKTIDGSIS